MSGHPQLMISEFCETGSGGTPSRANKEFYGGNIPWVKSGELREGVITATEEMITERAIKESSAKIVPKGSILLAMYGATVGRMAFLGIDAATNQAICNIRPDPKRADPRYVFHSLQSQINHFLSRAAGGAQPNISQGIIKETKVPLPPLDEQRRIAAILDKADELRRKRKRALEILNGLTQSIFTERFSAGAKDCVAVKLSEVCSRITDGVHQKPAYAESGVPFISVKDITTGRLLMNKCKFISVSDHEKYTKRCKPEFGDILYTKVGATYGRPALVDTDRPFSIYVSVALIKPKHDLIRPKYLKAVLGLPATKAQADRRIKGIGVPDLHLDQIQNFVIPLPSIPEQVAFERLIEKFENIVFESTSAIMKLQNLFSSLQSRAFSGKL